MVRGEKNEIKPISPTQNIKFRVGLIGIIYCAIMPDYKIHDNQRFYISSIILFIVSNILGSLFLTTSKTMDSSMSK